MELENSYKCRTNFYFYDVRLNAMILLLTISPVGPRTRNTRKKGAPLCKSGNSVIAMNNYCCTRHCSQDFPTKMSKILEARDACGPSTTSIITRVFNQRNNLLAKKKKEKKRTPSNLTNLISTIDRDIASLLYCSNYQKKEKKKRRNEKKKDIINI